MTRALRSGGESTAYQKKKLSPLASFKRHTELYWQLWLLVAPALIFVLVFAYIPMWGIQLAFREFDPDKGLTGGQWVGLATLRSSLTVRFLVRLWETPFASACGHWLWVLLLQLFWLC